MKKSFAIRTLSAAAMLFLAGCASYTKPAAVTKGSVYTGTKNEDKILLPADVKFLTLEHAQNLALKNNPDFRSKYYAIAAARANYYQSYSSYFPTATASFTMGQNLGRMGRNGDTTLANSQTDSYIPALAGKMVIFDSLNREMNILAARHNWRATEADEDDARRLLVKSVANAFNGVMQSAAEMRIALQDMQFNADMVKDTQIKFEAGAVSLSEVLNFKIKYNNAESNLIRAQYTYAVNRYSLAQLLGITDGTIPDTVKFPEMPTEQSTVLPDVSVYLDMALANRPDLKGYRERLEMSKYKYWQTFSAFGPTFTANYALSYNTNRTLNHYSGYSENTVTDKGAFTYGLEASWNLFNGGKDYFATRSAQAAMIQADFAAAKTWIAVIVDVRTAYDNYIQNVKLAKLYQKTYELTRQTRDLVDEEYRVGNVELTRLNEAQRDMVDAESSYVSAVVQMANAKAQLQAAANIR